MTHKALSKNLDEFLINLTTKWTSTIKFHPYIFQFRAFSIYHWVHNGNPINKYFLKRYKTPWSIEQSFAQNCVSLTKFLINFNNIPNKAVWVLIFLKQTGWKSITCCLALAHSTWNIGIEFHSIKLPVPSLDFFFQRFINHLAILTRVYLSSWCWTNACAF